MKTDLKIGIVLGAGSARGWAHIGVLRALEQAGIRPQIVCGASIGALVGAVYANGGLDALGEVRNAFQSWSVESMMFRRILRWLSIRELSKQPIVFPLLKLQRVQSFLKISIAQ